PSIMEAPPSRHRQDDLAEDPPLGEQTVSLGDALERQDGVDDRPQAARGHVGEDLDELGLRPHRRSEERQVLEEEDLEIELDVGPARRAAGHEAPAAGERAYAALPG